MVRHVVACGIAAVLGSAFLRDPGCGGVDSPAGALNAPCTRDKDCRDALVCREGVCVELDASAPSDAGDAQSKDAARDGA